MRTEKKDRLLRIAIHTGLCFVLFACISWAGLQEDEEIVVQEEGEIVLIQPNQMIRVIVRSELGWTDAGFNVIEGQEYQFSATGTVLLQRGNPIAYCGPDGYDLRTIQQPIKDANMGALVGKIVQVVSVEIDEETEEEIRNELIEYIYIGASNKVRMPISGRLYLGVNENVTEDNSGDFRVLVYLD